MALYEMTFGIPTSDWNLADLSTRVSEAGFPDASVASAHTGNLVVRVERPHASGNPGKDLAATIRNRLPEGSIALDVRAAILTSELNEEDLHAIMNAKWGEMS